MERLSKTIRKETSVEENIYKMARMSASKQRDDCSQLAVVSRELGITESTLSRYENDYSSNGAPAETVVAMSRMYSDPNLRRCHCSKYCAIGKIDYPDAKQLDMTQMGYMFASKNKVSDEFITEFFKCMEDGVLSDNEKKLLKEKYFARHIEKMKLDKDIANIMESW